MASIASFPIETLAAILDELHLSSAIISSPAPLPPHHAHADLLVAALVSKQWNCIIQRTLLQRLFLLKDAAALSWCHQPRGAPKRIIVHSRFLEIILANTDCKDLLRLTVVVDHGDADRVSELLAKYAPALPNLQNLNLIDEYGRRKPGRAAREVAGVVTDPTKPGFRLRFLGFDAWKAVQPLALSLLPNPSTSLMLGRDGMLFTSIPLIGERIALPVSELELFCARNEGHVRSTLPLMTGLQRFLLCHYGHFADAKYTVLPLLRELDPTVVVSIQFTEDNGPTHPYSYAKVLLALITKLPTSQVAKITLPHNVVDHRMAILPNVRELLAFLVRKEIAIEENRARDYEVGPSFREFVTTLGDFV